MEIVSAGKRDLDDSGESAKLGSRRSSEAGEGGRAGESADCPD